jgi:hypothetical protein
MKSGLGAGSFEAGESECFRRAERAGGPHALRGRRARGPGEHGRGERVRIPAGQAYYREALATGVGGLGYDVGAEGLPGDWRGPAALNPAGQLIQGVVDTVESGLSGLCVQRRLECGHGLTSADLNEASLVA